jgi:hypothetical protein
MSQFRSRRSSSRRDARRSGGTLSKRMPRTIGALRGARTKLNDLVNAIYAAGKGVLTRGVGIARSGVEATGRQLTRGRKALGFKRR